MIADLALKIPCSIAKTPCLLVGNFALNPRVVGRMTTSELRSSPKFEKCFPVSGEFRSGDGFESDCVRLGVG